MTEASLVYAEELESAIADSPWWFEMRPVTVSDAVGAVVSL